MSVRKRTPVHFPRMKIRGARNKYKSSDLVVTTRRFRVTPRAGIGNIVTFDVDPQGTHIIEATQVYDGWGRNVTKKKRP